MWEKVYGVRIGIGRGCKMKEGTSSQRGLKREEYQDIFIILEDIHLINKHSSCSYMNKYFHLDLRSHPGLQLQYH